MRRDAKKDAAGNTPAKLTEFETRWRDNISSGEVQKRFTALKERQALPLEEKIELSKERIREWYEAFDGQVAVSFSGGKDSAVLLWLTRQLYPDVPGVFCNTGLEYPEITDLVRQTENIEIVRPKKNFSKVIKDHGWPVVSKKVARGIEILRNPTMQNKNIYRLYDKGVNRFGNPVNGFKVPMRWRFLIDAPFLISDKCCEIMKKEPMHRYTKKSGRVQMVGLMASDSKQRERTYLQTGCNAFDLQSPRSMPLGFWTSQDVLECLQRYDVQYAKIYGDIVKENGLYKTTGAHSTGCVYCCFGLHLEQQPNRFQQLKKTHPSLFKFCNNKMGLGQVLQFINENCPDQKIANRFSVRPYRKQVWPSLFSFQEARS